MFWDLLKVVIDTNPVKKFFFQIATLDQSWRSSRPTVSTHFPKTCLDMTKSSQKATNLIGCLVEPKAF
jgi:hypothetical protein